MELSVATGLAAMIGAIAGFYLAYRYYRRKMSYEVEHVL